MGDKTSRKLTELRRFLTFQDVSIICLTGHVDALSRLKHGFDSRWGHQLFWGFRTCDTIFIQWISNIANFKRLGALRLSSSEVPLRISETPVDHLTNLSVGIDD